MNEKLIPAHVLFARWFIRIRWFAVFILPLLTFLFSSLLHISLQEFPLYVLSVILLLLNIFHELILRWVMKKETGKILRWIKNGIHLQIVTDFLMLTVIIHYSGGVENPIIIFYFFHMIISSSIFSARASYTHTFVALTLLVMLAFAEYNFLIPHYSLGAISYQDLYLNKFYIFGGGLVYAVTSILLVSLTHMIVVKSVKVEEAYVRTNLELKNKDKVQNDYVLRVTHDIKGHLAAIYSCLGVLRNNKIGELNDKQAEFVGRAYERTDLLVGFVRDLLNLTRKRQRQDEDFEEFSYRSLLDKMVASILPHSSEKSIEFNVVIDESVGNIIANPYAIEELYSNLLLNAVKYTPVNGQMELIVRNRPDYYITEISDSGIGIPKEELMKVFDEFFRGSNVPKEFRSGSGLGLSIAKQIVENHKGRIWVNSEPGVWTRFSFILPKNPAVPVTPRL